MPNIERHMDVFKRVLRQGTVQPWLPRQPNNFYSRFPNSGASFNCPFAILTWLRADAIRPVGIATIPRPTIRTKKVNTLPPIVIGTTSPYPTVVTVAETHQNASNRFVICASSWGDSIR